MGTTFRLPLVCAKDIDVLDVLAGPPETMWDPLGDHLGFTWRRFGVHLGITFHLPFSSTPLGTTFRLPLVCAKNNDVFDVLAGPEETIWDPLGDH